METGPGSGSGREISDLDTNKGEISFSSNSQKKIEENKQQQQSSTPISPTPDSLASVCVESENSLPPPTNPHTFDPKKTGPSLQGDGTRQNFFTVPSQGKPFSKENLSSTPPRTQNVQEISSPTLTPTPQTSQNKEGPSPEGGGTGQEIFDGSAAQMLEIVERRQAALSKAATFSDARNAPAQPTPTPTQQKSGSSLSSDGTSKIFSQASSSPSPERNFDSTLKQKLFPLPKVDNNFSSSMAPPTNKPDPLNRAINNKKSSSKKTSTKKNNNKSDKQQTMSHFLNPSQKTKPKTQTTSNIFSHLPSGSNPPSPTLPSTSPPTSLSESPPSPSSQKRDDPLVTSESAVDQRPFSSRPSLSPASQPLPTTPGPEGSKEGVFQSPEVFSGAGRQKAISRLAPLSKEVPSPAQPFVPPFSSSFRSSFFFF